MSSWPRWTFWILLAFLWQGISGRVSAQLRDKVQDSKRTSINYRKFFVDQSHPELWPRGVYAPPMTAEKFESLINRAKAAADSPKEASVRILTANYSAVLRGDQLVEGRATLDVQHTAERPTLLSFDGCNLAITDPEWNESGRASIGMAANGDMAAIVKQSGMLGFQWTARGKRNSQGHLTFQIQLAPASRNVVVLELPAGSVPVSNVGILKPDTSAVQTSESSSESSPDLPEADTINRWRLELGGQRLCALNVLPQNTGGERDRLVRMRQSDQYDISFRGVTLTTTLVLDVQHQRLHDLTLSVDEQLGITDVQQGNQSIEWSVGQTEAGQKTVTLQFAQPIAGPQQTVTISAISGVTIDRDWRLPAIRPQGVFWQEGSAALSVERPMALADLKVSDGRQASVGWNTMSGMFSIQHYLPTAYTVLRLKRSMPRIEMLSGTTLEIGDGSTTGRTTAKFRVTAGNVLRLDADLPSAWSIGSVTAADDAAADNQLLDIDWSVTKDNSSSNNGLNQQLRIRFAEPIRLGKFLTVTIDGRRTDTRLQHEMSGKDLRFVDFRGVEAIRKLRGFRAEAPLQLGIRRASRLEQLPDLLTPAENELLGVSPLRLAIVDSHDSADLGIFLSSEPPRYTIDIDVVASVTAGTIREIIEITCIPDGAEIDHIKVQFSNARDIPVNWSMADGDTGILSARRLEDAPNKSERWEIGFREPQDAEFVLQASRSIPWSDRERISLVSVSKATEQRGTLTILTPTSLPLNLQAELLQAIPVKPVSANNYSTTRASFRYNPDLIVGGNNVSLEISRQIAPTDGSGLTRAWLWSNHVESFFGLSGPTSHRATLRVENLGQSRLTLQVPAGTQLIRAFVNYDELPITASSRTSGELVVPLPEGERFPLITVDYTSDAVPLHPLFGHIEAKIPTFDIPVLATYWNVWLPPDYQIDATDLRSSGTWAEPIGWSKRLFGILRDENGAGPFNLLSRRDWRALAKPITRISTSGRDAEDILEWLGRDATDWRELLTADPSSDTPSVLDRLVIDRTALTSLGITPDKLLEANAGLTGRTLGTSRLQRLQLALLIDDDLIALTSSGILASGRSQIAERLSPCVVRLGPGTLRAAITSASQQMGRYEPLGQWLSGNQKPIALWTTGIPTESATLAAAGWNSVTIDFDESLTQSVHVYQPRGVGTLAWLVFFTALIGSYWKLSHSVRRWALLTGGAGLLALSIPVPLHLIASSLFLGLLVGRIVAWLANHRVNSQQLLANPPKEDSRVLISKVTLFLFATFVLPNAPLCEAQGPVPETLKTELLRNRITNKSLSETVHKVLIPINEKEEPIGDYYLPRQFHRQLRQLAQDSDNASGAWLIQSAVYRCSLEPNDLSDQLFLAQMQAVYEIESFSDGTEVPIDLRRDQISLVEGEVLLDDRPIDLAWNKAGTALVVQIDQPGKHQLKIGLHPSTDNIGSLNGFELSIPPIPNTLLEVKTPVTTDVRVPSALGAVTLLSESNTLLARLGPTNRLAVNWPKAAQIESEQLLWMHVNPGSVEINARFRYHIQGSATDFSIETESGVFMTLADPQHRFEPLGPPVENGNTLTYVVRTLKPVSGDLTFDAVFRPSGSSAIGNILFPYIELHTGRTTQHLLAVSVDNALDFSPSFTSDFASVASGQFLRDWRSSVETDQEILPPQFAYRVPEKNGNGNNSADMAQLSLMTRHRDSEARVDQTLVMIVGRETVDLTLNAKLVTTTGEFYQYRIAAPLDLRVDNVALLDTDSDEQLEVKWSRDSNGAIVLMLDRATSVGTSQLLTIKASLQVDQGSSISISPLGFLDRKVKSDDRFAEHAIVVQDSIVHVFRLSDCQVNFRGGTVVQTLDDDPEPPQWRSPLHFVRSIQAMYSSSAAVLEISENSPTIGGLQITRLIEKTTVAIDFQLTISEGVVDTLCLDVPAQWDRLLKISPPIEFQYIDTPGEGRRQLWLLPKTPIGGEYSFRLSVPVPADLSRIPSVVLQTPISADPISDKLLPRYLILPSQYNWTSQQLKPLRRASDPRIKQLETADLAAYLEPDDGFPAVLRSSNRTTGQPRVFLADVNIACKSDRSYYGSTTFDLDSAGRPDVVMRATEQIHLVQVLVEGICVLPKRIDKTIWRIPLEFGHLPQRIEVVFSGQTEPQHSGSKTFVTPTLDNVLVEQTLWTVRSNGSESRWTAQNKVNSGARNLDVLRLQANTRLLKLAPEVRAESTQRDINFWFLSWGRRWQTVLERITDQLVIDPAGDKSKADDALNRTLVDAKAEQEKIATSLDSEAIRRKVANEPMLVGGAVEIMAVLPRVPQTVTRKMFQGRQETLSIASNDVGVWRNLASRFFVACCLMLALGAIYDARSRRLLMSYGNRSPYLLGLIGGIAWWIWLRPSILGWVIISVSLFMVLRSVGQAAPKGNPEDESQGSTARHAR